MPNLTHFEDKIRRSSSFRSMTDLHDYLEYASHCRDQLQVYFYMQENNIFTDSPQFWLAMLNVLKLRCQFKLIIKKLLEIKKNTHLRQQIPSYFRHQDYYQILQFEDNLTQQLQQDIRKRKGKRRRSVQQFQLFSISKIQKKKRKVGGIEIYVDQDCRDNYKLEDYSQFFINNMKDEIQMRRFEYDRKQSNKPLSFLGMHESNIQKWSFQLIDKNKKNSFHQQNQQQKQNINCNGRDSMAFRVGNNDVGQSINVSKRFSISRKSNINMNLLIQNNPQSGFKTPKENIFTQTPVKNNRNYQALNKQSQVIGTPVIMSKKLINDKSLVKACKKSQKYERYDRKLRYSSSESQNDDITKQLNKQILAIETNIDDDDDHSFNYPSHKQIIRINKQDENQIHTYSIQVKEIKNIFNDKKQSVLDLGCVEWSLIEDDKKMDVENQIDKQLKETIFMAQLQNLQTFIDGTNQFVHLQSNPVESMFCQKDSQLQQSQSQSEINESLIGIVMCLKSTQTLQSIDSNQQNLFSTQKLRQNYQNPHNLQAFRKDRKIFQVIPVQDKTFVSYDQNQSVDYEIVIKKDGEVMSLQGNDEIKQMIDEMDTGQDNHKNLVLETLRKKKMSELLMSQIRQDQKQHNFGTHSQKKNIFNGLKLISQQKSYNSQRRYNSRERFSSDYFGDFS